MLPFVCIFNWKPNVRIEGITVSLGHKAEGVSELRVLGFREENHPSCILCAKVLEIRCSECDKQMATAGPCARCLNEPGPRAELSPGMLQVGVSNSPPRSLR